MSATKVKSLLLQYLPLILIILLAATLRLYQLGQVPISMSDDEIREVYTSYSIAHTGKDAFGNFMPMVFKMDGASTYGQVSIYSSSIFFLFLKLSPFTARLPFALSGILSVLFLYLILKQVLRDGRMALIGSFVLSVSVWAIQLSRIAIETDIAMLVYLIAIWLFLVSRKKLDFVFILSMLFFFLAFYSYAAFKIILVPILIILVWYRFKDLTKKHLIVIIATVVLAFGSFGFLSITQNAASYSATNGDFFFFQDKMATSQAVELERRASFEPNLIKSLYHNKFTYWGRVFAINYLTFFSPQYLFLDQEANGIYSIWGRGEFYVFELPLFLIGFLYLFIKKRKEFYLLLSLLLISPLPSALGIGNATWTSRSGMALFWLCAFIGAGIYCLFTLFKNKRNGYAMLAIILFLYLFSLIGYVSQYYFDWSRTNAKYFSKSTQDLVYKIDNFQAEGKQVWVSGATVNTFMHYAFYNGLDPKLVQSNINNSPIKLGSLTLQKECLGEIPSGRIYIASVSCKYKVGPSMQIKNYDNTEVVWNIYEK